MFKYKNGYIFPFVLWLCLLFLVFTFTSLSVYQNKTKIYKQLMTQLEIQSVIEMTKTKIDRNVRDRQKVDNHYQFNLINSQVNVKKEWNNENIYYFLVNIELNQTTYVRTFNMLLPYN